MISIRFKFSLQNNTENRMSFCRKMIRLKNPWIRSSCKARSSMNTLLDFLLDSQTKIKHDRKTMTKKKICRYSVTSSFHLSIRLLITQEPWFRWQRHMTQRVPVPSRFEGYLHGQSHLLVPVEPWDVLPEPKCLRLSEFQRYKWSLLVNSILCIFAENLLGTGWR